MNEGVSFRQNAFFSIPFPFSGDKLDFSKGVLFGVFLNFSTFLCYFFQDLSSGRTATKMTALSEVAAWPISSLSNNHRFLFLDIV